MAEGNDDDSRFQPMGGIDDLVKWLGVPKKTVYKWTSDKHAGIPFYRVGRHLRFRFTEVDAWLKRYHGSEGVKEFNPTTLPGIQDRNSRNRGV